MEDAFGDSLYSIVGSLCHLKSALVQHSFNLASFSSDAQLCSILKLIIEYAN